MTSFLQFHITIICVVLSLTKPNLTNLSPSLFLSFVFAFDRQYLPASSAVLGGSTYIAPRNHFTRATSAAMFYHDLFLLKTLLQI